MSDALRALLAIETVRLTCTNRVIDESCGTVIALPVRHLGAGGRPVICPGCGYRLDSSRFEAIGREIEELKTLCTRLLRPDLGDFKAQLEPKDQD